MGLSEAVNQLARRGLMSSETGRARPFLQRTAQMGLRIDVSNIAEALDIQEPGSRSYPWTSVER
jgi:hypothetical protein